MTKKRTASKIDDTGNTREWVVEAIVGHKGKPGHRDFRVKWRGFDDNQNTWETEAQLEQDIPEKLKSYIKRKNIQGVTAHIVIA